VVVAAAEVVALAKVRSSSSKACITPFAERFWNSPAVSASHLMNLINEKLYLNIQITVGYFRSSSRETGYG
jgi:hypothetical protein